MSASPPRPLPVGEGRPRRRLTALPGPVEQHFHVDAYTCLPTEVATFTKNAYPDVNVLLGYQTVSNFVHAKNHPSIYDPDALKAECEEAAADAGAPKWGIRSAYNF